MLYEFTNIKSISKMFFVGDFRVVLSNYLLNKINLLCELNVLN